MMRKYNRFINNILTDIQKNDISLMIYKILFLLLMKKGEAEHQHKTNRLSKCQQQVSYMLKQRHSLAEELCSKINQPQKTTKTQFNNIEKHIVQYNHLQELIQIIGTASSNHKSKVGQYNKFWTLNQNIERQVEEHLRNLKQMDSSIDGILNQEYNLCNQIEEIQENIRNILNRKDANNINQCEPLLSTKTKTFNILHRCKEQKEKIKDQKLHTIRELLRLLQQLKTHRQNRLTYCKDKKLTSQSMNTLTYLIKDLKQMSEQKEQSQNKEYSYRKLLKTLQFTNERINKIETELMEQYEQQRKILQSAQHLKQDIQQSKYLQQRLFQKLKMQPKDISVFLENSTILIQEQQEKKKQLEQILQGINTTNQTIKIFKHIQDSIENQNKRKMQLLKTLQYLQEQHEGQTATEERIHDLEGQLQKIELQTQRLHKKLSTKADQADVQAYKNINIEIQHLQTQGRAKYIIIKDMKKQWSEKARHLFLATNSINDEFNDILSEVVPQVWFRDNDFSKQQTIKDLNLYLIKTFNRLNAKE